MRLESKLVGVHCAPRGSGIGQVAGSSLTRAAKGQAANSTDLGADRRDQTDAKRMIYCRPWPVDCWKQDGGGGEQWERLSSQGAGRKPSRHLSLTALEEEGMGETLTVREGQSL